MRDVIDIDDRPYEEGCLIYRNPEEHIAPGVAVFTTECDEHGDPRKRSVHFSFKEDVLIIEEFGVDYNAPVNIATEYIQIPKPYAEKLMLEGKVIVPLEECNVVRPVKIRGAYDY